MVVQYIPSTSVTQTCTRTGVPVWHLTVEVVSESTLIEGWRKAYRRAEPIIGEVNIEAKVPLEEGRGEFAFPQSVPGIEQRRRSVYIPHGIGIVKVKRGPFD